MIELVVADEQLLEQSVFAASQDMIDAIHERSARVRDLKVKSEEMEQTLQQTVQTIVNADLRKIKENIEYQLSEDMHTSEVKARLRKLKDDYTEVRRKKEDMKRSIEKSDVRLEGDGDRGRWWLFGL